uniref:Uncharacterized protein n=1 Tax=Colobus angolensis palliatus TaxID=336983 RepID=A0A2K5JHR3_COLAP
MGTGRKSFRAFLFHHSFSWCCISFGDLNPFSLCQIWNRRAYHLEKVQVELTELEDFLHEQDTSPDKGELVSNEEEYT